MDDVTVGAADYSRPLDNLIKRIRRLRGTSWIGLTGGAALLVWAGPGVLPLDGRREWPMLSLVVGPAVCLVLVRIVTSLWPTRVQPWRRAILLVAPGALGAAPFLVLEPTTSGGRQWLSLFGLIFAGLYGSDALQLNGAFSTVDRLTRPPAMSPWPPEVASTRLFLHPPEVRTAREFAVDWHQQQWLVGHHAVTVMLRTDLLKASTFGFSICLMIFSGTALLAEPAWHFLALAVVLLVLGPAFGSMAWFRHEEETAIGDRYGVPVHPDDADAALRSAQAVVELLRLPSDELPRWGRSLVREAVSQWHDAIHMVRQAWVSQNLTRWRGSAGEIAEVGEYAQRALDSIERWRTT